MNGTQDRPLILIVDDMRANVDIVRAILGERLRSEIAGVTCADDMFDFIKTRRPDLILLDVMMPDVDGFAACEMLKRDAATKDIPVIFLTALFEAQDVVRGLKLGAADYVTKPFNADELLARIGTHLKLKRQKELIEQQVTEQRELLHVLCHDLANPIASALSVLEMSESDPSMLADFREDLTITLRNGMGLIELARKTRAFNEGRLNWELQRVNLRLAVETVTNLLRAKFQAKDIHHELDIPADVHVVAENNTFLNTVLCNIFTNAIKFSPRGSKILVSATTADNKAVLAVKDHGVGIPPEILADLFVMGRPTKRDGTEGESGTGFGMPLLRKFVEAYGGSVAVVSTDIASDPVNHGTELMLSLPLA